MLHAPDFMHVYHDHECITCGTSLHTHVAVSRRPVMPLFVLVMYDQPLLALISSASSLSIPFLLLLVAAHASIDTSCASPFTPTPRHASLTYSPLDATATANVSLLLAGFPTTFGSPSLFLNWKKKTNAFNCTSYGLLDA